jgi:predicted DNA-binding transcriptional regulator YafY
MGRRSATETVAKIFVAFLRKPVHSQADLQRHCGVGPKAVRAALLSLQEAGVPLEHEKDWPHVYWSLPREWKPGRAEDLGLPEHDLLARLIARLPRAADREKALSRLWTALPGAKNEELLGVSDELLETLERSIVTTVPVRVGYFSASRGAQSVRVLSVQRISYGPPIRFAAQCHASSSLKWFRADRCTSPTLLPTETYQQVAPTEVERFVRESLDGFHGDLPPTRCTVVLRDPEARWASRSLPGGARAVVQPIDGGARLEIQTTALDVLARFLVGLGAACVSVAPLQLEAAMGVTLEGAAAARRSRLNESAPVPNRPVRIGRARGAE